MIRLVAGLIAVAWAVAGWMNLPRLAHPQASAAGFAIAGTCLVCYWLGAKQSKASAWASAWAKAEARANAIASSTSASTSTAQVAVIVSPALGANVQGRGRLTGLEAAPWMLEAHRDAELEQDFLAQSLEDGQGEELAEYA